MGRETGFEPATFGTTSRRSKPPELLPPSFINNIRKIGYFINKITDFFNTYNYKDYFPSDAETLRATKPRTAPAIPDKAVKISGFPRLADCKASVPARNAV